MKTFEIFYQLKYSGKYGMLEFKSVDEKSAKMLFWNYCENSKINVRYIYDVVEVI